MKIAVWHTGHEISDTVCKAIIEGLPNAALIHTDNLPSVKDYDCHIAYGILRGTAEVFKEASKLGLPWFNVDRGYWEPGHYAGYYRISLNGTQQTTGLDKLEPDYERWDKLGLEILPPSKRGLFPLVCGPTPEVETFFERERHSWWETQRFCTSNVIGYYTDRRKGCERPLQKDLDKCSKVVTFNSSVGWEALRQGIPVVSDSRHSFLGAYMQHVDNMPQLDIASRCRCFAVQAGLQLTLPEIRQGLLWPLIQKLLANAGLHRA